MVCAAHYILGPFGGDCDLRRYGERIAERGGANAKKRAVVAVARKLAVLMHRLWVDDSADYDPFYNLKRAEKKAGGHSIEVSPTSPRIDQLKKKTA